MKGLTDRQREVLDFIMKYKVTNGYSPTYQEIAFCLEVSIPTVYEIVQQADKKGYVRLIPGKARTLTVKT